MKVDYLFWYGAVALCRVVKLCSSDADRIPEQLLVRDEKSMRRARKSISAEDCHWLEELADVIVGEFRACGWEWDTPKIGVESTERVKRGALRQLKLLDLARP